MKAVAYRHSLPSSDPLSLIDINIDVPQVSGHDLLVHVAAISVNPVDCKVRMNVDPQGKDKILGWDAVGTVVATGEQVSLFKVGDKVFYAGDITRSGSNAEFQLVDERIAARKPDSLSDAQAAALPLTSITAWEMLFDRLDINKAGQSHPVLLVLGGAGGVGSILIQLAKTLTQATVVASASRKESVEWIKQLGADYVINHHLPLKPQLAQLNLSEVSHIACTTHAHQHLPALIDIIQPQGKLAIIEYAGPSLDIGLLKDKSLSLHWEFMFTRAKHQTPDMQQQHNLLTQIADMVDQGLLKTTLGHHMGKISAQNLRAAHQLSESHQAIGKIVLEGFE